MLIGVSLMPPTVVNLLSLVGPNPLLEPSPICFNSVFNFFFCSLNPQLKLRDEKFAKHR